MAKRAKSKLAGKVSRSAFEKHKSDPTDYGDMRLPAGIEAGVAELSDIGIRTHDDGDNKGKPYFTAAGVVRSPKEVDGIRVEGMQTRIFEPLYDTPTRTRKTEDDHVGWMLNALRKLGLDTEDLNVEDLEQAMEQLKEEGVFFRFRTWKGQKQTSGPFAGREPRVQEQWLAAETNYEAEDNVEEVVEDEEEEEVDEETEDEEEEEDEEPENDEDDENLDELGAAAEEGDDDAQTKLFKLAEDSGADMDAVNETETWMEVVDLIKEAQEEGDEGEEDEESEEEESEEEEEEFVPEKGEYYKYKPPRARKSSEHEVISVAVTKQTVSLKALETGKVYKGVSWDELEDLD